nr:hypothetical protein HEP87_50090 [Streptomyces sp. S1D4-11]
MSLAAIPPATVQRLLGGRAGRQVADRARGRPRPVAPRALPVSASVSRTFPRHILDGAAVRAALLDLVVTLALQLRRRGQAARGPTLALRFAGAHRVGEAPPAPGGLRPRRRPAHAGLPADRRGRTPARPPHRDHAERRGPGRRRPSCRADQLRRCARGPAGRTVDSTIVRAHPHAAGARKKGAPAGEAADHAIGRSRGGLTTKIHLTAAHCRPLAFVLTGHQRRHQRHEMAQLEHGGGVGLPSSTPRGAGRRDPAPRRACGRRRGIVAGSAALWGGLRGLRGFATRRGLAGGCRAVRREGRPGRRGCSAREPWGRCQECGGWSR